MSNADLADFVTTQKRDTHPAAIGWVGPALAWGLVMMALVVAVPKFEEVFRDFGIDASRMMNLVIGASHLRFAVLGVVVVLIVADSIVRDTFLGRKDARRLVASWSAFMFGLPLSAIAFMVVALGLTMIGLIEKLSG